jgi:FkbM family methyltransferase
MENQELLNQISQNAHVQNFQNEAPDPPKEYVARPYHMVKSRHGLFMVNENDIYIGKSFLNYGEYSYDEWLMLESIMQAHPGNILEIGANIGSHTLGMAKLAALQGYQVFAFEPQPIIYQQLCANLAINAVFNTEVYPYGCSNQKGSAKFIRLNPHVSNNFGGVGFHTLAVSSPFFTAPIVTLDETLAHVGNISLIKVDVEGMELEVLQGAQNIIQTHRPILYIENDKPEKSVDLISFIESQNYNLWWHIPRLYSANNFYGNPNNIFGVVSSFNMLCLPKESNIPVVNLVKVDPAAKHPLAPV